MQSFHPVECICQCTIAYTGWPVECSAGKLSQQLQLLRHLKGKRTQKRDGLRIFFFFLSLITNYVP